MILSRLLQEKMEERNVSMRQVGRETSLSTTTIGRILNGEPVDVDTLVTVCDWIGASPSEVLNSATVGEGSLGAKIAAAISTEPGLSQLFGEAVDMLMDDRMSLDEFNDLISYAAFRIKQIGARRANRTDHRVMQESGRGTGNTEPEQGTNQAA